MSYPLEDVKVLDLTRLLPGPFCTLMLADYGAEVLRIEDTGAGDYLRFLPPYYGEDADNQAGTRSAAYLALNRGKRAMRLDLKNDEGREILLRLVESHDVLVESFRPGVMEKLGLGYETLCERNSALVYCAISGYGQDGVNRDRAGHDMNYLSLAGMLGLTGRKGGPPVQAAGQIADLGGGALMALFGIMSALHERSKSGKGQFLDVSMTDGALTWLSFLAAGYFCDGNVPLRGDPDLSGGRVCYFVYETADGRWMSLGALEPKFWQEWCAGIDRDDLVGKQLEHPDSDTGRQVAEIFKQRTMEEWVSFSQEHECCLEPILELDEALESDLFKSRSMVVDLEQPRYGKVRQIGPPIKFSRTPAREPAPAPEVGEHTDEVLSQLGFSDEEIDKLKHEKVV